MLLLPSISFAQGLVNNGASIIVNGTSTSDVFINLNGTNSNYINQSGGLINCININSNATTSGSATSSITVGGNWTNNATNTAITGTGLTAIFNNTTATQTIGGSNYTTFFNLICSGLAKNFNLSSSLPLVVAQNFTLSSTATYSNISSISIGKLFMGTVSLSSGSIPVTIGDSYSNSATGYTVTGDWTYNGSISDALAVGALNYSNLNILSNTSTNKIASLNGTTTVAGILTVADKCTFQTNNTLTLLSTVSKTASVAALTGTANIQGTTNVQRMVTGSYGRSYRLISSPVYLSTAAGFYNISSLISSTPITGPNPGTGSFDASNTNNSSVWMYREGDPFPANTVIKDSDYKGIYSLTENIPVGTGLLFFNRGNRTTSLTSKLTGPTFPAPEDNAIVFTGILNQGGITVKVPQNNINNFTGTSPYAKESPGSSVQSAYYYRYNSSYAPVANMQYTNWYDTSRKTGDQATDGFNLIGNPYASTIDLDQVTFGSDINPLIYVFNPINKQFSYYRKGSATSGSTVTDGNGANRYIAIGQGFFVRCNVVGSTNAGVTFAETNKVSTQLTSSTSPALLMSARTKGDLNSGEFIMGAPINMGLDPNLGVDSRLMVQLKTDSLNYDGIGLFFNKNYSAKFDKEDGGDMDGMTPNVYLSSYSTDKTRLAINKLPTVTKDMRIKLFVDATSTANQQLRITDMVNIMPKYNVYVIDHRQKDSLLLNVNNAYNFNINRSDTTSNGGNRLELVFKLNPEGVYKLLNFTGAISNRNVVLNWTTKNEATYTVFTIEKSLDGGKTFITVGTIASNGSGNYAVTDNNVDNGSFIYRLKQSVLEEQAGYSNNVLINFNALNSASFFIYPNPTSNFLYINLPKPLKGNVEIRITDMKGVNAIKATVNSNNIMRVDVSALMPGVYVVEVTDTDKNVIGTTKFIKN